MWKRAFFSAVLLSVCMCFFVSNSQAASLSENIGVQTLSVSLDAGMEKIISPKIAFRAFAVNEVEGLEVRFLQDDVWTNWQGLEQEEENIENQKASY